MADAGQAGCGWQAGPDTVRLPPAPPRHQWLHWRGLASYVSRGAGVSAWLRAQHATAARARVDFNVPMSNGVIASTQRIVAALPTIAAARAKGAKCVVLMSHLGRPGGKVVNELSLRPVAAALSELMAAEVTFVPACVGTEAEAAVASAEDGAVLVRAMARSVQAARGKRW